MQGLLAASALLLTLCCATPTHAQTPPKTVYEVYVETQEDDHDDLIVDAAEAWHLDPFLLKALLFTESGICKRNLNRDSGAAGCGQFTRRGIRGLNDIRCLRLHKRPGCRLGDEEFTRAKAFEPGEAIPASAELLSWLVERWGWSAVKHYNGNWNKRAFAARVYQLTDRYRTSAGLPPLPRLRPRPRPAPFPAS